MLDYPSITKRQKNSMNMQLHETSVSLRNASKVLVYKYINIEKQRFVKFLLFLHFIATGKFELLGILVLSRWRNIGIQAPHIQNPVRFRRFNIVQTSRSRGQHLCSKFAKIPHLGCPRTFKVPTSSRGPPLGHNIDSCIMSVAWKLFGNIEITCR